VEKKKEDKEAPRKEEDIVPLKVNIEQEQTGKNNMKESRVMRENSTESSKDKLISRMRSEI